MKNLNEAVVHLINEDIVNGRKIIENELYVRLGNLLEEKLKDFAPTVFSEGGELSPKQKKIAAKAGNPNKIDAEDLRKESCDNCDDLLEEDDFMGDLKKLVESIEEDIGEELTESEIEELANILMEDSDPDEDEEEEEDFEEDLEETE